LLLHRVQWRLPLHLGLLRLVAHEDLTRPSSALFELVSGRWRNGRGELGYGGVGRRNGSDEVGGSAWVRRRGLGVRKESELGGCGAEA
jgi:hypothetical protein